MKIAFVCNEYPIHTQPGGIGIFTHTIAHGLVERDDDVTVVGFGRRSGQWNDHGVRVIVLPESKIKKVSWLVNRYRLWNWLRTEARAGRIDIIESPESHGLVPFSIRDCPVVIRLHLNISTMARNAQKKPRWLLRRLEKRTLACHKNWIAVSKYILQTTLAEYNVKPDRTSIVYNPIPESKILSALPFYVPKNFVLYAGTVSDRKGAYVLAEAAKAFLAKYPDLHLVYIGGIIKENGLLADERILRILGNQFADRVHFTGPIDHDSVLACMKRAKVFAFPSKLESFGLVPLEAMSCGVPVVYSNLHAGPEVINDGITGLLADPFDPGDVAEKVTRLLNDPHLSARLTENAKKAVMERFSLQRCIEDTLAFYSPLLKEHTLRYSRWKQLQSRTSEPAL